MFAGAASCGFGVAAPVGRDRRPRRCRRGETKVSAEGEDWAVRADRRRSMVNAWGVSPTQSCPPRRACMAVATQARPDSRFYVGGKTDGTLDATDSIRRAPT